ncbi:MAG: hypothetical protein AAFX92_05085 [Pseudomonadota bacterium]
MNADGKDRTDTGPAGAPDGRGGHRIVDWLDRWGADLEAWPDQAAAGEARRMIDRDPVAQAHWAEARALDGLLDTAAVPEPSPDLADRIFAKAVATLPPDNVVSLAGTSRRRRLGWPSVALAASLVMGLVVGVGVSPDTFDGWLGGTTVYAADYLGFGSVEVVE